MQGRFTNWIDGLALVLSSFLIAFGMEYLNVSGQTDLQRVLSEIGLLAGSLLLSLVLFARRNVVTRFWRLVLMILVGLSIWLTVHTILLITYYDRAYVSIASTEEVIKRHLLMLEVGIVTIPIFGIVVLAFVGTMRLLNSFLSTSRLDND